MQWHSARSADSQTHTAIVWWDSGRAEAESASRKNTRETSAEKTNYISYIFKRYGVGLGLVATQCEIDLYISIYMIFLCAEPVGQWTFGHKHAHSHIRIFAFECVHDEFLPAKHSATCSIPIYVRQYNLFFFSLFFCSGASHGHFHLPIHVNLPTQNVFCAPMGWLMSAQRAMNECERMNGTKASNKTKPCTILCKEESSARARALTQSRAAMISDLWIKNENCSKAKLHLILGHRTRLINYHFSPLGQCPIEPGSHSISCETRNI